MTQKIGKNRNNHLLLEGLSDFKPVALSTTDSAVWERSGFAGLRLDLGLDCFWDFFAMPQHDTARLRREIKIQTDPLPKKERGALVCGAMPQADFRRRRVKRKERAERPI
jgi:hypothetical protein